MVGFLVEYTIHDDDDGSIRDIVESILTLRNYYYQGTTLYYMENRSVGVKILNNYNIGNICNNEKKELLKLIKNKAINDYKIYDINNYIEIQVFAVAGGSD
ncbi:hypothetical protein EPJ69_04550 [Brachyspira aalborgi]|uniref:Uncharacterized protein n=1 Tax=Brachyspira aalborgi TaxID=29522 RepID=A0A5C8E7G2_9SPIR|nr:hypothetical protein [Brachyspira aalborgi]TXJ33655.1 hypothetical protein EPJ69_04550 [Brachyspira aalborgi]